MENKPESLMDEKAYCHTYDSFVRELSSRMAIDDEKILPKEGDKFDYEDINSWISAVDYKDGKVPDIEAGLSAEKGKNPVTISVLEQETIKNADEKVSNESLLYSMALTEAKMKVISDIAEETYPAVAFQIGDYRKEMEKIREEILGSKEAYSSLNEILGRMTMRRGFLVSTLVISGMILAACGFVPTTEPRATVTSFQPQVTETSPAIETPGATETPFVEVTPSVEATTSVESPTLTVESMTKEEIINNVNSYLDGKITFEGEREKYLYRRQSGEILPVGHFFEQKITTFPQFEFDSNTMISVLLGIYRDGDKQIVLLGSKDVNGRPFVWAGITGYLDKDKYPVLSRTYIKLTHEEFPIIDGSVGSNMFKSQDELLELYSNKINLPLYFGFDSNMVIKDPSFGCGQLNELECSAMDGNNAASDELIAWIKEGKIKPDFVFDNSSDFQIQDLDHAPLVQNHTVNTP